MANQSVLVKPSLPPIPGVTKLTPIDQIVVRFIVLQIFAFSIPTKTCKTSIIANLQHGLSLTLDDLPFLVAEVVAEDDERDALQMEVVDNAGVWFHFKETPDLDFCDLERRGFPPQDLKMSMLVPAPYSLARRSPVLTLQANLIRNGMLLTVNFHHSVFDGVGIMCVIARLANHVSALANGNCLLTEISGPADDRMPLCYSHKTQPLVEFPTYREAPNLRQKVIDTDLFHQFMSDSREDLAQIDTQFDMVYWKVSLKSLQALQLAAKPPNMKLSQQTEGAILTAYVWRQITRARRLSERGYTQTRILFPIDIRLRMDPPLPIDYTGNAVLHAIASASVEEMESREPLMLFELAQRITDAIAWWTSDRIADFVAAVDACPDLRNVELDVDANLGPDLDFTNMSWSRSDNLDWGKQLGTIKAMRFPYFPIRDGWAATWPRVEKDWIQLVMAMEKKVLSTLKQDEEWTSTVDVS